MGWSAEPRAKVAKFAKEEKKRQSCFSSQAGILKEVSCNNYPPPIVVSENASTSNPGDGGPS